MLNPNFEDVIFGYYAARSLEQVRTESLKNPIARSVAFRYYLIESGVLSQCSSRDEKYFCSIDYFDGQEYILNIHRVSYGARNDVIDGFGGLEGTNRTA